MSQGLSQSERLVATHQFLRVKSHGLSVRTSLFWLQILGQNDGQTKLGIIVTKRLGNAVKRNRAKRVIRELFRCHKHLFCEPFHLVVLPRRSIFKTKPSVLESTFKNAINKAFTRL